MKPFLKSRPRPLASASTLLALMLLAAGCASPTHRAPVEQRQTGAGKAVSVATSPTAAAPAPAPAVGASEVVSKPPPGVENLGKPGYYAVKPGETLIRIALDNGQNWRDIARWNALDNPNRIEVGQVLRVVPPAADTVAVVKPLVAAGKVESRPLNTVPATVPTSTGASPAAAGSAAAVVAGASAGGVAASGAATAPTPGPVAVAVANDEDLNWAWPASGPVATNFDEARNKGLVIAGKAGDPVLAAADGRVVYAGSGLRGYGNLIIVKHNSTFLTAYAHNQALLVKEDQVVRRGQKIAEMGASDADRVQLHFEIRRQGKPIDPAKLLPAR
jgi:lipoprotein NlpD